MAPCLEAIFWDVDGTLAETELEGHRVAFNRAFAEVGLPWRWEPDAYLALLAVAGGRERLATFLTQAQGEPPASATLDALVAAKQRHYAALLQQGGLPLRPGVARLIAEAAAAGLTQMIVTTSSRSAVAALLAGSLAEQAAAFSGWICGEDVQRKKPDPGAYRLALGQARLGPAAVVVLEDSAQGLAAAHGAGLTTVVTLSSLSRHEGAGTLGAAAAVVDGLGMPAAPTGVVRGPACPGGLVTVAWLERLLATP
jgi:HAD superfamily hydrolase (TIGR01509 family)